ncbi:MAG: hypothetical protein Q8O19_02270, partial [Rectinemataceae bacterium]|nr:hypothetical protein [Rectinemataceae bacterium]
DIPEPSLNQEGFYCEVCEKEIAPGILHGHIDGIITDPLGRDYLLEHKAFSTYQCDHLEKELPWDNLTQAVIYSKGLQLLQPDLDQIILLIKNKNTAQYLEFECTYNAVGDRLIIHRRIMSYGDAPAKIDTIEIIADGVYRMAVEKFAEVYRWVAEKELPRRPFPLGTTFPCGYCLFGKKCFEGYIEEIQALSTDIALSEEIETAARYVKEMSAQISEMEKEKDETKASIRKAMDDLGARTGRAGEYEITISVTEREKIDKSLVPAEAITLVPSEKMLIKKLKEPKIKSGEQSLNSLEPKDRTNRKI